MAQVYMVICDESKNVLVAKKSEFCSFWGGTETGNSSRVNGGGRYAYPGGRLEKNYTPKEGAYKEFHEETGNPPTNLTQFIVRSSTNAYKSLKGQVLYYAHFVVVTAAGLEVIKASSSINITVGAVTDKELASVEIMTLAQAKSVFSNASDPVIGWFHQPTLDIETV